MRFVTAKLMKVYRKKSLEKVVTLEEKSLEKIDIAIQKAVLRGCFFYFQMIMKNKKVTGHPVPERRKDENSEHFL